MGGVEPQARFADTRNTETGARHTTGPIRRRWVQVRSRFGSMWWASSCTFRLARTRASSTGHSPTPTSVHVVGRHLERGSSLLCAEAINGLPSWTLWLASRHDVRGTARLCLSSLACGRPATTPLCRDRVPTRRVRLARHQGGAGKNKVRIGRFGLRAGRKQM